MRLVFRAGTLAAILIAFGLSVSAQVGSFIRFVEKRVADEADKTDSKLTFESICPVERDKLAERVFLEYGAMFVATKEVRLPTLCIFRTPPEVDLFQRTLETKKYNFNGFEIELQEEAMEALIKAKEAIEAAGLTITPLDGAIAGRRSYADTLRIWNLRFYRALDHWEGRGKIMASEADAARNSSIADQIPRVVEWEKQGFYFSTNFSKSIFQSVAPPGTSQHLSLLAFDVVEAGNPTVRHILNKNGWFQTIRTDQPHFTFLGVEETELPKRGLRMIVHQGHFYWVPNIN